MNELHPPIMRIFEAYKAAVFAKDVDAFVALYDQDVCVFDLWSKWSYEGLEAWRGMVADWLGSLGTDRVAVEVDDVQTSVTDDLAVAHAFLTFKAISPEGRELRAMQNRLTWVLRQKSGAWKIVHQHTSAPVSFETFKVTLRR
jgi:uncharacterized protein (TIGR02246 family)